MEDKDVTELATLIEAQQVVGQQQETVIAQQPSPAIYSVTRPRPSPREKALREAKHAVILATVLTIVLGIWLIFLPFTIASIVLGILGFKNGEAGNLQRANIFTKISIICSGGALFVATTSAFAVPVYFVISFISAIFYPEF